MGEEDTIRQALNVYRMRLLGAEVVPRKDGHGHPERRRIRGDAGVDLPHRRHPLLPGLCDGPHPFPAIVRDFQAVISREIKAQLLEKEGRLPDAVLACVGAAPTPSAASIISSETDRSG